MMSKMCDKCKGFECFRNRALHIGIGVTVALLVAVAYLLWLFVADNKTLFGTNTEFTTPMPEVVTGADFSTRGGVRSVIASPESVTMRDSLYVGIMTMERYIDTRARTCNETWGQNPAISKLQFYATLSPDHGMAKHPDVINLPAPDSDDIYRTGGTFRMLRYVCDVQVNRYDWFVRAVDDSYIRTEKLTNLLSFIDKRKKIYAGHPVEVQSGDSSSPTIVYCAGGPGIIFSRRALKGLCPHLEKCEAEFRDQNADEQLGRCVHKYTGLECTKSTKFRDFFYNSHERNLVALYSDMLRQDHSVTLHPLKATWMMKALHQHNVQQSIKSLNQKLEDSRLRLERLKSYSKTNYTSSSSLRDARFTSSRTTKRGNPPTVISASMIQYQSHGCQVQRNSSAALVIELRQAIALSNSSFRWGDMMNCGTFLGATYEPTTLNTNYNVHFKCFHILNTTRQSLATSHIQRATLTPQIVKTRERALGAKLVVMLPVYYSDPKVLDFLFMWNDLLYKKRIEDFLLVLLIIEPPGGKFGNKTENKGHLVASVENTLKDLTRWSAENNIHVRTYYLNRTVRHHKIQKTILKELKQENENSVILFAKPNLKFDETFLFKCRIFVRPGKQIYRPYAMRREDRKSKTSEFVNKSETFDKFLWTSSGSPLCIHLSDLLNITHKKKPKNSGSKPNKPIKIIYSYDDAVEIKSL